MTAFLKNTFSWSVSRDLAFRECPRKYYFSYYGHWGGWADDAAKRTREIYILKNLKNRSTWVGQTVHSCIARSLQNVSREIPVLPLDEILSITRKLMRQDFRHSRSGSYRQDPRAYCGLFEHEYDIEVTAEQWREAAESADHCLRTFYRSETFGKLRESKPVDFLEIEQFSTFSLDGSEVKIKLDCATRETERIVIWDWKTGKKEADPGLSIQMGCYALYARGKYGVDVARVTTRRFDLAHDVLLDDRPTQPSLDEIAAYIQGSVADMKAMLRDPANNLAEEGRFAKAARPGLCRRCNFFKVCRPDI